MIEVEELSDSEITEILGRVRYFRPSARRENVRIFFVPSRIFPHLPRPETPQIQHLRTA